VLGTGPVVLNGGALASDGVSSRVLTNAIALIANSQLGSGTAGEGSLVLSGAVNAGTVTRSLTVTNITTLSGAVTNTAGLTKAGKGVLILGGANTYSGDTTVSNGTIRLANSNAVPNSMVILTVGNGLSFDSGIGTFNLGGLSGIGNQILEDTNSTAVTLSAGGNNVASTFSGILSGAGGLTKVGAAILTITGANTYTNGTIINGGAIQITSDAQLGAVPATATVNLTLNSGTLYNNNSTVTVSANRTISLGALGGYLRPGWGPKGFVVNGLITGVGGLTVPWEGGIVTLNAMTDYQGTTTIGSSGGGYWDDNAANPTLRLGVDNGLPYGAGKGNVVFGTNGRNNTATLDLYGHSAQINGLTGGSNAIVDNQTGTGSLTVGNNDQTSAFGGTIKNTAGSLALTKVGTGIQTLSGVNTYTGATAVSEGTLRVNGSLAAGSEVSVAAGAKLAGTGSVYGVVTTLAGAILSSGLTNTLGTLTLAQTPVLNGGILEVNVATNGASSLLNVAGSLSVANLSLSVANVSQLNTNIGAGYTIATATSGVVGRFTGNNLPGGWGVQYGSTNITLVQCRTGFVLIVQ